MARPFFPRATRADWAAGLDIPVLGEVSVEDVDVVYWVGCAGAHDARYQKVARTFAQLEAQAVLIDTDTESVNRRVSCHQPLGTNNTSPAWRS